MSENTRAHTAHDKRLINFKTLKQTNTIHFATSLTTELFTWGGEELNVERASKHKDINLMMHAFEHALKEDLSYIMLLSSN